MPRFVILGQPRSGTTYLQTLLNSHPDLHCRGELFDPWQIDDDGTKTKAPEAIAARDLEPIAFFDRMMSGDGLGRTPPWMGAKILFQHHPRLFSELIANTPDLVILYVRRRNKLAQFASLQQVRKTGRWTDTGQDGKAQAPKLSPHPYWAKSECNRLENEDFFLERWLETLPNPVLTLEYTILPLPETQERVAGFLSMPGARFSSPLRKQGQNRILDRFENTDEIKAHFTAIGKAAWLGTELDS